MRRLTRRQRVAAAVLAAVALCFVTLDLGGGGLREAHAGVRGALGSLYRGTDAVIGPVRRFVQGVPSAGSNSATIAGLRRDVARLQGQLDDARADHATAQALARLQLVADRGRYSVLPARVTALGSAQGFDWTITLDVGTSSGVRTGQSVTDGDGLVGRVLHADSASSVVLLAADPRSGVGVRDLRSGAIGVASGLGTGGFHVQPLDPAADIRVGDRFATGPTGSTSFVPGLAVGTVTAVRASGDGTTTAQLRGASAVSTLDLVGVVLVGGQPVTGRAPLTPGAGASSEVAQR